LAVILFGGSFDPIHKGHLAMMQEAHRFLPQADILLIPAACSPFKTQNKMASEEHRLKMCCLAVEDAPFVKVTDMEFFMEKPSYTVHTVEKLQAEHKDAYYFLCGADSFLSLQRWKNYEKLIGMVTFLVTNRGEVETEILQKQIHWVEGLGGKAYGLPMEKHPASSTLVRQTVKEGKSLCELVSPSVERYIQETGLYKE
jgi:nicotinate-nucleotide adenylyltransferase